MQKIRIKDRIRLSGNDLNLPFIGSLGFARFEKATPLEAHSHSGFEITYLESGSVCWELENGEKLRLKGGDIALIQPEVFHKGEMDIISPSSIFWMTFDLSNKSSSDCLFSIPEKDNLYQAFKSIGNITHCVSKNLNFKIASLKESIEEPFSVNVADLSLKLIHTHISLLILTLIKEIESKKYTRNILSLKNSERV